MNWRKLLFIEYSVSANEMNSESFLPSTKLEFRGANKIR